ncbi:hypothetical protein L6452_16088 [Arctium lappa]|uniref:Uncharacterized protein n=1 Tax=Arctium lappa TaxID=4217 RepID=A0ACB9BZU6_ARCLA|nr:hypothetical protein L6452_16088 [Arctium lappa]
MVLLFEFKEACKPICKLHKVDPDELMPPNNSLKKISSVVKILCHLHHDQLRVVFHVSERVRKAISTRNVVPTEHWPFARSKNSYVWALRPIHRGVWTSSISENGSSGVFHSNNAIEESDRKILNGRKIETCCVSDYGRKRHRLLLHRLFALSTVRKALELERLAFKAGPRIHTLRPIHRGVWTSSRSENAIEESDRKIINGRKIEPCCVSDYGRKQHRLPLYRLFALSTVRKALTSRQTKQIIPVVKVIFSIP